jgi:Flp pilus assembly protein TadG
MVLLVPVLVGAILVIAAGARLVDARGHVETAAAAAARAASLQSDPGSAGRVGRRAGGLALTDGGPGCAHLAVRVDTRAFRPGGYVRATVTCVADLSDLAGFGLPGHETFTATSVVPIETHRVLR